MNISPVKTSNYEQRTMNNEPIKQTQSCQACVVCEGVAGLMKPIALRSVNTYSWPNKATCHFFLDRLKFVCILGK